MLQKRKREPVFSLDSANGRRYAKGESGKPDKTCFTHHELMLDLQGNEVKVPLTCGRTITPEGAQYGVRHKERMVSEGYVPKADTPADEYDKIRAERQAVQLAKRVNYVENMMPKSEQAMQELLARLGAGDVQIQPQPRKPKTKLTQK